MKARLAALAAVASIWAAPAVAEMKPVVIELFTSQGCSSCPPADALLGELAGRDDVIPLALHVDYWDYIGWKDEFADPMHTKRQRGYARAAGHRTIYTPQMIVGGVDHVIGYKPMQLGKLIEEHHMQTAALSVLLTRIDDSTVQISAPAIGGMGNMVVQLIRYQPEELVKIRRGENAGRTLKYHNIVSELRVLGAWDGAEALAMDAEAAGEMPVVVLIQQTPGGRIIAANRLR